VPLPAPSRPGERWSMDFMADTLADARGFRTLDGWAYRRGVTLRFIRPGKPIENAYVESFNGKFRDKSLNEHWFLATAEPPEKSDGLTRSV
jgi:hypothetical protein